MIFLTMEGQTHGRVIVVGEARFPHPLYPKVKATVHVDVDSLVNLTTEQAIEAVVEYSATPKVLGGVTGS